MLKNGVRAEAKLIREAHLVIEDDVEQRRSKIVNCIPRHNLTEIYHSVDHLPREKDLKEMRARIDNHWPEYEEEILKWVMGAFVSLAGERPEKPNVHASGGEHKD